MKEFRIKDLKYFSYDRRSLGLSSNFVPKLLLNLSLMMTSSREPFRDALLWFIRRYGSNDCTFMNVHKSDQRHSDLCYSS